MKSKFAQSSQEFAQVLEYYERDCSYYIYMIRLTETKMSQKTYYYFVVFTASVQFKISISDAVSEMNDSACKWKVSRTQGITTIKAFI